MALINFVPIQPIKLLFVYLFVLYKMPMPCAEKTLCERRLATLPSSAIFYYQRIELNSAALCAERCVDDWEFCRSAVLIEDIRNKSLCQLYSGSFESRIPLNLPPIAPLQTDPNRLLPITLVELTDAPCSSKFARQSTIFDQISADAREQLQMIPGPAVRNRLDIAVHASEKATKTVDDQQQQLRDRESDQHQQQTYLAPFSSAQSSSMSQPSSSSSSSSSSSAYVVPFENPSDHLHQQQPTAPLQFPPNGLPIQPAFVSRGNQRQQQFNYNNGCSNGICPKIGAQMNNNNNNNNNDDDQQQSPCAARKSSDPCAPQAQWMEWSSGAASGSCSVTCGSGWRERRRHCSSSSSSGNPTKCKGEATDRERCVMPDCNQWTEWTEWAQCSSSCGGGQQIRRRSCQDGDQCVGASIESRQCNAEQCAATWSNWGSWSECSATCGQGTQRRVRECEPSRHSANAFCAVGNAVERRECELRSCPEWSQWEPWSACSKSCGAGESVRRRECRNAASKDECQGEAAAAMERVLCNTQLCPTWTPWTEWSSCSKNCGTGAIQTRKRECRYNGMSSDECAGAANDEKQCTQLEPCPKWAEWGEWSDCTTSCGHGKQSRVRKCLGHDCAGNEKEMRSCQKATCPYFDQWSEWGGCSVTCGRGFCERKRKCIKHNNNDNGNDKNKLVPYDDDGLLMPIREEMVEGTKREKGGGGQQQQQPEDITSADTIRPLTLEVIQSSAVRRRSSPLISSIKLGGHLDEEDNNNTDQVDAEDVVAHGSKLYDTKIVPISAGECVGPSVERKACDAGPCCSWTKWSPWSDCIVQCGSTGFRDRTRRCELTMMQQQTESGITADDAHQAAEVVQPQPPISAQFPFGASRNFGMRCVVGAKNCMGESRQIESCAIPTPKSVCGAILADQPNIDERLPKLPVLIRSKMRLPDISLRRDGIGVKGKRDDENDAYQTAGKFGRRAVDKQRRNEAAEANDDESNKNGDNDDDDTDLTMQRDEQLQIDGPTTTTIIKRSSSNSLTTALAGGGGGAEVGAVTATTAAEGDEHEQLQQHYNCTWTEWSAWSDCGGADCSKKRSRTCVLHSSSSIAHKIKCECDGNFVQQTKCPAEECRRRDLNVFVDETAASGAKSASSSFIKRVQLIPRHKVSDAEKRHDDANDGQQQRTQNSLLNNDFLPLEDSRLSTKLIRISGLRVSSSNSDDGDQKRVASPSSSPQSSAECAVDDWLEWSEWSACEGFCGTQRREGHRTRHRSCACQRGCAGIAEESLSCTISNCP